MHRHLAASGAWIVLGFVIAVVPAPASAQRLEPPLVYDDPVFEWKDNRDPDSVRPSPSGFVGLQVGSTRIMIAYARPAVKGRQIFGGLVPYGRVWRTGADEATTITLTGLIEIERDTLLAGTYSLFTIPGEREWTVIFNRENNQWGARAYHRDEDVLRITVPAQQVDHQERLSFTFEDIDTDEFEASVVLRWEDIGVSFRVREP